MLSLIVGALGLGALGGDRMVERKFDDVAVIELPARIGESMYAGERTTDMNRLAGAPDGRATIDCVTYGNC